VAQAQTAAVAVGESEIRLRPPWLVALLEFASENTYEIWWYGRTWWELKRARNDPSMRPVWHALALYVPIYGLFRLHAHYRVLSETAAMAGATDRVSPGLMVVLAIVRACIGALVSGVVLSVTVPVVLDTFNRALANPSVAPLTPAIALPPWLFFAGLIGVAVGAWQLYRGQQVLNAYYATGAGAPAPRALTIEWVFVVLFALRFLNDLLTYLRPPVY
jgi:hypothetical protein